jgi:nucleoside 2-deoxyribosyltransferase
VREVEQLEVKLRREGIEYDVSKTVDSRGISGCLEKIDRADVVYVVNPGGYVGKSVSLDVGYAYAKGKPVYALHTIDDPPMTNLLSGVISHENLIEILKQRE